MARNTVVIGLIWYALVVTVRLDIKHLLNAICVIAILNVLFANFQYCGLDPYRIFTLGLMKSTTTQPTGLMANKNILSGLLAMSLPCFFRQQWKWFVPFIFYGLTIASSLGGAIPVVVMVLVYFVLKDGREGIKNNFFKVSALSIWFLFFATYIDHPIEVELSNGKTNLTTQSSIALPGSTNIRTEAWEKGLRLYAHNHPIFGYGIGHWKLAFLKMATPGKPIMTKAHNEFIQGLFEMGVIFPILVLGYLWNVFKRYRKEALIPATALGIIAINSSVNFQFHIATTAIIAVTLMAILEIQLKGGYESA